MSNNHDLHDEHISRLYKLGSKSQPSKQVDERIIQTARAFSNTKKRRSFAWPTLATAAVLVLSISLVLKVLEQKPLEESVMESMSTDDQITQPQVMEKEEQKKPATPAPVMKDEAEARFEGQKTDSEAKPERLRAKQRSAAPPASVKEADSMGAAKLKIPAVTGANKIEAKKKSSKKRKVIISPAREVPDFKLQQQPLEAPAFSGSIQKRSMEKLDCSGIQMPETDSVADWSQRYKSALEQGQLREANCLKQAFHSKFGKTMPVPAK